MNARLRLSDRRLRMFQAGLGLNHRDIALGIVDFRKQVPLFHPAAAVDVQCLDEAGDLGKERRNSKARIVPGWLVTRSIPPRTGVTTSTFGPCVPVETFS